MPIVILMRQEIMTIPLGELVSKPLAIPDVTIVGMIAPGQIDHNTVYFDVSADGQTYVPLADMAGTPIRCVISRSNAATFDALILRPWWYVKLRLTVPAAAERRYTVLVRPAWGG